MSTPIQKRVSAAGAIVTALIEAIGLTPSLIDEKHPVFNLVIFGAFCAFVYWHIRTLHGELDELRTDLENRKRRRLIRSELGAFAERYRSLLETGDKRAARAIDVELERYCHVTPELAGYWGRISSGARAQTGTPPRRLLSDDNMVDVWSMCQTRRYHLADALTEFKD